MTPNLTVGYMAEQINRGRLDSLAARGSLVDEVGASRPRATGLASVPGILGAALIRLGGWLQGTVPPSAGVADPAALAAR